MKQITAAIELAREDPCSDNLEAMWRHVMRLPAWYLLPSKLEGPATPLVTPLDGGNWVVAFTHFRALNTFAREHEMRSDTGEVPMLAMPPKEAMERVAEFAQHIDGIVFNMDGELVFRAPTAALVDFAGRFLD